MIPRHRQKYLKFREFLVETRKRKGITQEELGNALGIPQSLISKCERGVRRLDIVETLAILKALSIDPRSFLKQLENELE